MTRWDLSETERLPEYMKGLYVVVFETVNELAQEAEKTQGRDTLNYVRKAVWTIRIHAYKQIFLSDNVNLAW
jgi:hypothetical protein